jgi:carboxypeptidase D
MLVLWQNEHDVAAQFVGFLQQFLKIFKELKGKKFYATGESVSTRFLRHLICFDSKVVCRDLCAV